MDVGPNLGTRANRGPGINHAAFSDSGANVDVTRHHHCARSQERTPPSGCSRHDSNASFFESRFQWELVGILKRPDVDGLNGPEPKEEQDRLLEPFIHHHLAGGLIDIRHPLMSLIEQGNRLCDECISSFVTGSQGVSMCIKFSYLI